MEIRYFDNAATTKVKEEVLKENSLEGMQGLGKGDLTSLKDVFLIDYDLNVRYIASKDVYKRQVCFRVFTILYLYLI